MLETPISVILKHKGSVVHTIGPQETVYNCVSKLNELGLGALMVVEDENVLGIVSERDVIRKFVSPNASPNEMKVADIMTTELITLSPSSTIEEAMSIMTENRFRHIPIIEENELVGIISIGDITKFVMVSQEFEIGALTEYIQGAR